MVHYLGATILALDNIIPFHKHVKYVMYKSTEKSGSVSLEKYELMKLNMRRFLSF